MIAKLLENMKIKVSCCVPDCPDSLKWHILDYLYAVLMARSLKPYVCIKHHHLFDDVDMSDYDPVKDMTNTAHTSHRVSAAQTQRRHNQVVAYAQPEAKGDTYKTKKGDTGIKLKPARLKVEREYSNVENL